MPKNQVFGQSGGGIKYPAGNINILQVKGGVA